MTRDEHVDKKIDHAKEGEGTPKTSSKVAGESVTDEPQAQRYEPKFKSYSGTADSKLAAAQGGAKGHAKDASGKVETHGTKHPTDDDHALEQLMNRVNAHKNPHKTAEGAVSEFVLEDKKAGKEYTAKGERHVPRQSFMDGLKAMLKTAKTPEQEAEVKALYSIEYMMKKAGDFLTSTQAAVTHQVENLIHPKPAASGHDATQHRPTEQAGGPVVVQDKARLYPEEVGVRVDAVCKAMNERNIWHLGAVEPNVNELLNILQPLSPVQRQQIAQAYKDRTHCDLSHDFETKLKGNEQSIAELQSVLKRDDTVADFAGALHRNFGTVRDTGSRLSEHGWNGWQNANDENDRNTAEKSILHTLQKLDKKDIDALNKQFDLHKEMQTNPHLSPATKQAMEILLQGKDVIKSHPALANQLAEIGLVNHRLDIFMQAMQLSPETGNQFSTHAGLERIGKVFSDQTERTTAEDYAQFGHLSLASRIHGNGRIFRTNKVLIADAIADAEPAERKLFEDGFKEFHTASLAPKEPYERRVSEYYHNIHEGLNEAAGFNDPAQVKTWERALLGIKEDPKVADVFKRHEENLIERVFHNQGKSVAKIEALANMSPSEQEKYRGKGPLSDDFRKQVDTLVSTHLQPGVEQDLARSVLKKIATNAKEPFDTFDQILLNKLKGTKATETFETIEKAFAENPERIRNDKTLRDVVTDAMHHVASGAGFDEAYHPTLTEYLFKTGHLPLDISKTIAGNSRFLKDILGASQEEKARLLDPHPDPNTRQFQEKILGTDEKRDFIIQMLKQHPAEYSLETMKPQDRIRAFVVGAGDSQDSLRSYLTTLKPDDVRAADKAYHDKYGHHIMSADVLSKLPPSDQIGFRNLLSNIGVTPEQESLDARHSLDANVSLADPFLDRVWDRSKIHAEEKLDKADALLLKYGKEGLTERQRKDFHQALENYYQAEKEYVKSKGAASKAVVDASITLATMAATLLVPEVTLTFMAAAGTGGAATNIGGKILFEGKSARLDQQSLFKDGVEGFIIGPLAVLGPEHLGLTGAFRVSQKVATEAAIEAIAQKGVSSLKPNADKIIAEELRNLTEVQAVSPLKQTNEAIDKIVKQVTVDGASDPVLAKAILEKLQANIKTGAISRLEAEQLLRNASGAAATNFAGEVVQEAAGLVSTDDLLHSLPQSAVQGAVMYKVFGVTGTLINKVFGKVESPHIFVARAHDGQLLVGKGTVVHTADGKQFTVDQPYALKPADKVDLRPKLKEGGHKLSLPHSASAEHVSEAAQITQAAREQSNLLAARGEVAVPLADGFTLAGKGRYISADGSFSSPWAATVIDKAHDPVLRQTTDEARTYMQKFAHLPLEQQQTKLTQFVESKFLQTAIPGHNITKLADDQYTQFIAANPGKRVNIGEFIERGIGGCTQQAALLKVLGDELIPHAHFKLVTGNGADGSNSVNHVWVQSGDKIYDPRQGTHGDSYSSRHATYKAASEMPIEARHGIGRTEIEPGSKVNFGGDSGWTVVASAADGRVVIKHDGLITVGEAELLGANPGLQLKVGESVTIKNHDGTVDSGWHIKSKDAVTGEVVLHKKDAVTKTVSPEQLHRHMPELAGAKIDPKSNEYAAYKAVIDNVTLLAGARRSASSRQDLRLTLEQAQTLELWALKLQKDIENPKTREHSLLVAAEFSDAIRRLEEHKVSATPEFMKRMDDIVHGKELPVVPEKQQQSSPTETIRDSVPVARDAVVRTTERFETASTIQSEIKTEPISSLSFDTIPEHAPAASLALPEQLTPYLLSLEGSKLKTRLVEIGLIPFVVDMNRNQPIATWLADFAARPSSYEAALVRRISPPEQRHLLSLSRAFENCELNISGKSMSYTEGALLIRLPAGTQIDGAKISTDATLKIGISTNETDRIPGPYEPRRLSPIKRVDLGDGHVADCYVQELVTPVRGLPSQSEIEAIIDSLDSRNEHLKGFAPYGKTADGEWKILDSSLLCSKMDSLTEHPTPAKMKLLDKLLVESNKIPPSHLHAPEEVRLLSSWLREALVRPRNFPALNYSRHLPRLWQMAKEVEHLNLEVALKDFRAGGESIVVELSPGTNFGALKLPGGGFLKMTSPEWGMINEHSGTSTNFWEARSLTDVIRVRTNIVGQGDTYIYVQEPCTPLPANAPEIRALMRRMKEEKPDWVFFDHNRDDSRQFGQTSDGRTVLMDWPAFMPKERLQFLGGEETEIR